jgi:hypothetical protein
MKAIVRRGRLTGAFAVAAAVSLAVQAWAPAYAAGVGGTGLRHMGAGAVPAGAVPGSTPERRAAWNALSAAQRRQVVARFERDIAPQVEKSASSAAPRSATEPTAASLLSGRVPASSGPAPVFSATGPSAAPLGMSARAGASAPHPLVAGDGDGDGLPDGFEQGLADAFTPFYHVSAGEAPGTGFATFEQNVPSEVVQSVSGPVPPISYFAVAPLGVVAGAGGQPMEAVRIDYFTLWNRDDGLQIDDTCNVGLGVTLGLVGIGVGAVLDGASSHALDNERSAALVAAPLGPDGSVDLNPGDYSAYSYYTAAHEGTFLDHSAFLNPSSPVAAGNHLNLALSLSKHSTYTFNPDGMPLIPPDVISAVYATIFALADDGTIDPDTEDLYLFLADTVFFSCIIEHFGEQGGTFAQTRINVGEPGSPLNGSAFIADPELAPKFAPLWG